MEYWTHHWRKELLSFYIAGWGCAQRGQALCCQGCCAKSCSSCLCSGNQLSLRATLPALMSGISPLMLTLLLIAAFLGCVIHMYVLLLQPAVRAPPVPFQHCFCQGGRSASVHDCAALPAHRPASFHFLPLHIPILLCSEHSQLGKAALLCFSCNVFTNRHCLSQTWPECSFRFQGLQALLAHSLFLPREDAAQEAAEMLEQAAFPGVSACCATDRAFSELLLVSWGGRFLLNRKILHRDCNEARSNAAILFLIKITFF